MVWFNSKKEKLKKKWKKKKEEEKQEPIEFLMAEYDAIKSMIGGVPESKLIKEKMAESKLIKDSGRLEAGTPYGNLTKETKEVFSEAELISFGAKTLEEKKELIEDIVDYILAH